MPPKYIKACNVDDISNEQQAKISSYEEVVVCPSCHYAISPRSLGAYYTELDNCTHRKFHVDLLCFCTRCRSAFLCKYSGRGGSYHNEPPIVCSHLLSVSPATPKCMPFSEELKTLSPGFVETYTQANFAETQQLFQVCGPGYRKALEFLVKDYLCHTSPDDSEKIRSELLGASIQRIEDKRVKVLAQRSTWIGNDETHYVRKHEDLGLDEMKRFIKAMLSYIESELAFEAADSICAK